MVRSIIRGVNSWLADVLFSCEVIYRRYLKARYGFDENRIQAASLPEDHGVLQNAAEWREATDRVKVLGLPPHPDNTKNWDSFIALGFIRSRVQTGGRILDAGGELYSAMLPWLFLCGYRKLVSVNLAFTKVRRRGPIQYEPDDITRTRFDDSSFDAVTCLSVIEHGVPLEDYFNEMARILKPGGLLITSCDYFDEKIDTQGMQAYGTDVKIFSEAEIREALEVADRFGLKLEQPINLRCTERPVLWERFGLRYTYVLFVLKKPADSAG